MHQTSAQSLVMPFEIVLHAGFAAAHAIRLPGDSLEPLHGHDWSIRVRLARRDGGLDGIDTVCDFHDAEAWLEQVISPWRNQNLNAVPPFVGESPGALAISPTAERVAEVIGRSLTLRLSSEHILIAVEVEEAPGCWAVYLPDPKDAPG